MRMVIELEGYGGFDTLYKNSWSGAVDTLNTIKQYHMEEELLAHLEKTFNSYGDDEPTESTINDYLSYEFDAERFVAENTAFNTLDDLDELEDYCKNLCFSEAQSTITEARQQNKKEALWEYLKYGFDMRNVLEVMEELNGFDVTNF